MEIRRGNQGNLLKHFLFLCLLSIKEINCKIPGHFGLTFFFVGVDHSLEYE